MYLYQIEDLLRAFQLDIDLVTKQLVANYQVDEKTSVEIVGWYTNLILMMEKEGIREKGHLQFLTNQIQEVNEFHLKLMETGKDKMYVKYFSAVKILISELNTKNNSAANDIQTSLDAIYGYLLLKLQKKNISSETTDAVKRLSSWLSSLSKLYKDFEAGELDF